MSIEVGGLFGLLLLVCVIYGILKTAQSNAGTGSKVFWILLLLLVPFLGFLLWLLLGPKS